MRLVEEVVEEREETSEKVEDDEEEREVITVREALVLSISSEKNLTTKNEPGMELEEPRQQAITSPQERG